LSFETNAGVSTPQLTAPLLNAVHRNVGWANVAWPKVGYRSPLRCQEKWWKKQQDSDNNFNLKKDYKILIFFFGVRSH